MPAAAGAAAAAVAVAQAAVAGVARIHLADPGVDVDLVAHRVGSLLRLPLQAAAPATIELVGPIDVPWERNRIWIWDASHFERAKRVAYAIVDVVTRDWIGYLLTSEMTSTQVQVLFHAALEDQGLVDPATGELLGPDGQPLERGDDAGPVLVAWSDNGPEMTSADTREFMALLAIAQHHGCPSTPTDQAHIESFFGHLKADWPHLSGIRDVGALDAELARVRGEYNHVRLHAGIGYVTPADEHHGRGPAIRRARTAGLQRARQDGMEHNRRHRPGSSP